MLKESNLLINWKFFVSVTTRVISRTSHHLSVAKPGGLLQFSGPKAALKIPLLQLLFSANITIFLLFPLSTNSSANWAPRRDVNCGVAENNQYLCFPVLRWMNKIGGLSQLCTMPWVQTPIWEQVPRATGACAVQRVMYLLGLVLPL